jgi:glucokinase
MSQGRLLADIGGTYARFGWQESSGAAIEPLATLACRDYADIESAIRAALSSGRRPMPAQAAIAVAATVTHDCVSMTNNHWTFSRSMLAQSLGLSCLRVLNDFAALALALPDLGPTELRRIGGGEPVANAPIGLIGPGTGLGVSGLLPDGLGGWIALEGEGGHATLAAGSTPREQGVLAWLARRYGHVSAERVVSGQGLSDLHQALCALDSVHLAEPLSPAAVSERGLEDSDRHCREALELFAGMLGTLAGNLALTLGARGGVYLGGGIVPRLLGWFETSPFRERFDTKGRLSGFVRGIPVWVILADPSPALRGAARALDQVRG